MPASEVIQQALALLGGQLDRGDGRVVAAAVPPVVLVAEGDAAGQIRAVLETTARVAIPVAFDAPSRVAHLRELLLARRRIAEARRRLMAAGATRVRVFAVVPGQEMLQLVYELGPRVQDYVEERVVLATREDAEIVRSLKRVVGRLAGVAASVAIVMVVGDRA
jgi:hypothetical protein